MPYIEQYRRDVFEQAVQQIVEELGKVFNPNLHPIAPEFDAPPHEDYIWDDDRAKGELNYIIFSIVKRYLSKHGMRYARAQDFIGGVLTCCQLELYRRLLTPYEQKAIAKNGDVD